jgi:hypothetical protein
VGLCPPYVEQWVGTADFERLNLGISDAVLRAASHASDMSKVEDARLRAMVEAVNAEDRRFFQLLDFDRTDNRRGAC